MPSSPLDLSGSHIPRLVQQNMIAYMSMFSGLPGVTTEDADTFLFVSNQPAPGNIILRTNWQTGGVEERIDTLFKRINRLTERIDWFIFPGDQPSDLGKRLAARGLPGGPAGNWLWADLTQLNDAPAVPDNFRIERVCDEAMMAEWVRISEDGFEEELSIFYDAYARHGYGADAFSLHYTGYLGDTPVTSGTLLDAGGCASIYDVSTPPARRGQGFGSALTHALMREIRSRGYADTWIWSSDMAKSVYQKLGYVDADFGVREHSWNKDQPL